MTRRRKSDEAATAAPRTSRRKSSNTAPTADTVDGIEHASPPSLLIRVPVDVRWRDLDAFSHVNNSTFLTYIEEARLHWFQSLPGPWLSEDIAPVLAATHVNYRRPIEWPARLVVELFAERVGATSLTLAHRITAADEAGRIYADGHSVLVWIDRHEGRPSALPDAVRQACDAGR